MSFFTASLRQPQLQPKPVKVETPYVWPSEAAVRESILQEFIRDEAIRTAAMSGSLTLGRRLEKATTGPKKDLRDEDDEDTSPPQRLLVRLDGLPGLRGVVTTLTINSEEVAVALYSPATAAQLGRDVEFRSAG